MHIKELKQMISTIRKIGLVKRNDFLILLGVLILASVIGTFNVWQASNGSGQTMMVEIKINGNVYKTVPLNQPYTEVIETDQGTNTVEVKNGTAYILDADCKDQICVNTKVASRVGESVVCLPHLLSLEIIGTGEGSEVDAISQ